MSIIARFGVSDDLSVPVDDVTLEIAANVIQIKDLGVSTGKLAATSVTAAKLGADVVGDGLSGGDGSAVSAQADATGGANLAKAIAVSANGIAVKVNDDTIGGNVSGQLEVKANSIGATEVDETDDYTWSGAHSFTSATVSVATPTQSEHACTKAYADALRNGIRHKDNALSVATANQTLSGVPSPIDGVTLVADDRILLTGQTTSSENGLWIIKAGTWVRPEDFAAGASASGSQIWVDQGTSYQDTMWECTTNEGSDIIDTNDLSFTQRPVGEVLSSGTGLTKSGTTLHIGNGATGNVNGIARAADDISAAVDDSTLEIASNVIQVKDLGVGTGKLAAISVTASKLGADVAGDGLSGGNGSSVAVDIHGTTPETTPASDDEVLIYDASETALRRMTRENFLTGAGGGETRAQEAHLVTSGEVTNGYFTLSQSPANAGNVSVSIHGGIEQLNKQIVGATGAIPDFDVLSSNQLHFNNNGAATGLSGDIAEGDVLIIRYSY